MKFLTGIFSALSFPLFILNMFGGIIAGVWLVVLGEWREIGFGVLIFFVSTFLLRLILMPTVLFGLPTAYFANRKNTLGIIFFSSLGSIYIYGMITIWCCWIFFLFVRNLTPANTIPTLIWSYGIATGPWAYIASKEQGASSFGSMLAIILTQFAYLTILILVLIYSVTDIHPLPIFFGFMSIGFLIQLLSAYSKRNEMT